MQRLSRGMTFMLNYTYSKTIDDIGTFRTGYAIPAGALANSTKAWPIDRIERSRSTQDQPQNLVITSTYDLPFGKGHIGGGNPIVRNIVGGWRISDIFTYARAIRWQLSAASSTCTARCKGPACPSPHQDSAAPHAKTADGDTARPETARWHRELRNQLSAIQYINPAAFSQMRSTLSIPPIARPRERHANGMVLGNTARTAPYGLRGPGNYNIDGDLRRTFDLWKDGRVKFIFEASVFNAVNHVWFGSSASTADGSIGSTTGSSSFGAITGQANSPAPVAIRRAFNVLRCRLV